MERQVDYHEIEEHSARFFRTFRWIIFGAAVSAVVLLVVMAVVLRAMGG